MKEKRFWQLKCVLMLNWNFWNRTDFCIKMDLALNNLQKLICRKNPINQPTNHLLCLSLFQNQLSMKLFNYFILQPTRLKIKNIPNESLLIRKKCIECPGWHDLMVKLQFRSFEEYWEPFHCYYSEVQTDPEMKYLIISHLWIK